ncbi:MAG TPA: alkaline phosphatase family protein, partial [Chloroflexota bacterium]|nr:alkaline phosphatase family protein [Chloroflexota bacterium]
MPRLFCWVGLAAVLAGCGGGAAPRAAGSDGGCQIKTRVGTVSHVIYIAFDNVHFSRDNPNVPSDLEQMPHLLSFLTSNGVVLTNSHTPLIAHTATDILTTMTGLYPSSHGIPEANSYRYFAPDGSVASAPSFGYWTEKVNAIGSKPGDDAYNLVTPNGANTPAPWVPFTRAGCNVGVAGAANMILEGTADVGAVFGASSAQAAEAKADKDQAQADYIGIGIHCAKASSLCGDANGGRPDTLPSEPGGYDGFQALFGHKFVAPTIGLANDLAG